MSLFQKKNLILSSGERSDFKIECDDLTFSDVETLCYLISKKFKFSDVIGVPSGGLKFEKVLKKYCISDNKYPILIVDDVLTTGTNINRFLEKVKINIKDDSTYIGIVIFSRGKCPLWVFPLFQML